MRSEFMLAINQLCAERKLAPEQVLEAVDAALISAYKRNFGAATNVEVHLEPSTGEAKVFAIKDVVETVLDPKAQISLREARAIKPGVKLGETVAFESTPRDFGRIAAQTAKQVIHQKIKEAEREAQFATFADSAGEIRLGTIQSIDLHSHDVIVSLDGAEAVLPAREQVPSERYRRGGRIRAYVMEVRRGSRGPQITLTRRSPALLRRLLELEVPEIFNGLVEIKSMAREAGSRSKVAVHATQDGVDPVGSCVGVRGGRIQNVVAELENEKIDVVQWDPDVATFIGNALSPAKVMNVLLDDNPHGGKTATVIVPDKQLSLAIGKEGQNARLAAKLTGWRIDIKSATEAAEETLGRLEDIELPRDEMDLLMLAEYMLRKGETSDLSPEQRQQLTLEVDRGLDEQTVWPEEEPVILDATPAEPAPGPESAPEARMPTEEPEKVPPVADDIVVEIDRPADQVPEPELPPEEQPEMSFAAEFADGVIGWVPKESQEDLYSGWDDILAQELPDSDELWEREELEEPEDDSQAPGKKKRKKKGGKSRYQRGREREW